MTRMRRFVLLGVLLLIPSLLVAQETPLLVTPSERGIVLRWVWGDGERPAGYFVERRTSSSAPWERITPQPRARIRDRAAARALLGDQFDRYSALLFPTDPRAERRDPETFRGMLLLSADLEPGVAHVLGLRLDDVDARAGTAYQYRLIALTGAGERVVATSDAVMAGGYRAAPGPDMVTAVPGPRGSALRWTPSPRFSGYHVYRGARRDGSDARRINDAPVVLFTQGEEGAPIEASATFFTDTAPPRDSAFYRVEGIDAFGRRSQRSLPAAIVYRAPVILAAPALLQSRVAGDTIVLGWQLPPDGRATAVQVWRASSDRGPFTRVGQPVRTPSREYRDVGQPMGRVVWYRVTGRDAAGNESDPSAMALAEIPDRVPPAAPDSVIAAADTGRLSLRWRHVAAPDLRGYRVYRALTADGTFALLSSSPRRDARFVDSIPSRADHPFYYRVTAVDSAFNESAPSAVVAARPPDITPPSVPVIAEVRPLNGSVHVRWMANPEPDVASYLLRYRAKGESAWRTAATPREPRLLSGTLTSLAAGTTYEVSVIVIDDAGNRSQPSRIVDARTARPRELERPDLKGASFERREGGVVVWWSAPPVVEVLVLRSEGDALMRVIGSVSGDVARYRDGTARPGHTYEYQVRVRDAFGNTSESRARRVVVPEAGS